MYVVLVKNLHDVTQTPTLKLLTLSRPMHDNKTTLPCLFEASTTLNRNVPVQHTPATLRVCVCTTKMYQFERYNFQHLFFFLLDILRTCQADANRAKKICRVADNGKYKPKMKNVDARRAWKTIVFVRCCHLAHSVEL